MKSDIYRNAMDHLHYSEELEKNVMASARPVHRHFRTVRVAAIAAICCMLLGCTAYAVGSWIYSEIFMDDNGDVALDFSKTEIMHFTPSQSLDGITVHYMPIGSKNVSFQNGLMYDPTSGFYEVTEDYELVALEHQSADISLDKNGKIYTRTLKYVVTDDGVITNLGTYTEVNGEILVNVIAADQWQWPVYLNVYTGEYRDAMPDLDENSFEMNVSYIQPFRGGFIVSTMNTRIEEAEVGNPRFLYWVSSDCQDIRKLDVPVYGVYETVVGDTLYIRDGSGHYYYMDDEFRFCRVEGIGRTNDIMFKGLLTYRGEDGTLKVADFWDGVIYNVADLQVNDNDIGVVQGYSATRNSVDGKIVVYRVDTFTSDLDLAALDTECGQLKQISVYSGYEINGWGWLDDNRLWMIYSDNVGSYVCVYDFGG